MHIFSLLAKASNPIYAARSSQPIKMEYNCKKIEISNSEPGVQVTFDKLNGDSELYFLIQKHFGEEDDQDKACYIESHNFDISGHYDPAIKLGKSKCEFEYDESRFVVTFEIGAQKYEDLKEILQILGSVEIINE